MKRYFISKGGKKRGTFTIEELKTMELTDEYAIQTEGAEDWKKITELEELKACIIITPLPTQQELKKTKKKSTIDFLKIAAIWLVILCFFLFLVTGGFTEDGNLENRYRHGEYKIDGTAWQIRKILLGESLLISTVMSIILAFLYIESE